MTRKEMKARARQTVRKHYMILVMTGLIAVFLGVQNSSFDNFIRMYSSENSISGSEPDGELEAVAGSGARADTKVMGNIGLMDVIENMVGGNPQKGREISEKLKKEEIEKSKDNRILGRSRGALSKLVNGITTGSLFVMLVSGINSLSGSENLGSLILIILALAGVSGFYLLIVNTYTVISARIFLEGRSYEKVPIQRFVFLLRVKRWLKVSMAMLLCTIYQCLWILTVIGGLIKYYSYYLVPYILAENPDLTGREAITLSRKMMRGHKWECFVLECTFIGWSILGAFTFGLSEILFSIPYQSAVFSEFYVKLRGQAKEAGIMGAERLDDRYLYEKAGREVLREAYADAAEWKKELENCVEQPKGFRGVLAKWFGIFLGDSKKEQLYEESRELKVRLGMLDDVVEGRIYPGRLSQFPETMRRKRVENFHYMRHYSVWSLVLMFFIFSMAGWCWEVSIHLVLDGVFVNRGALHGPWLPIYGAGGVLLLTVLNRLRNRPAVEFFSIILVCGMVEYWTSYYLEVVHDGMKWWEYSGYFLNLNGRICAEGLLVFGIGGMVIVYVAAPLLDNQIRRISKRLLLRGCLLLLCLCILDIVYSAGHPNEGRGITDYQSMTEIQKGRVRNNVGGPAVTIVCTGSYLHNPMADPLA